jgi:hypothetical protein
MNNIPLGNVPLDSIPQPGLKEKFALLYATNKPLAIGIIVGIVLLILLIIGLIVFFVVIRPSHHHHHSEVQVAHVEGPTPRTEERFEPSREPVAGRTGFQGH